MLSQESSLTIPDIECVSAAGSCMQTVTSTVRNISGPAIIDGSAYRLYPALWNAHEHLEFNLYPHIGSPPYRNAYDWGLDITKERRDPRIDTILKVQERIRYYWGALKNIVSATPYVLHHGETPGFMSRDDFLVSVIPDHGSPHSLRFEQKLMEKAQSGSIRSIHLAEGIPLDMGHELSELDMMGLLDERTAIVHGVGLSDRDAELMLERRASFIWCPSSNEFLFRQHAPVQHIRKLGIPIMLGTDSTLTGSDGMLSEIRFASTIVEDPEVLFEITTQTLKQWVAPFMPADGESYFIVKKETDNPLRDFIRLHRSDVLLVVHRGRILMYDPEAIDIQLPLQTPVTVDGVLKYIGSDWTSKLRLITKLLGAEFMGGIALC